MSEPLTITEGHTAIVPKEVLDAVKLKPGQRLVAVIKHGQILLVPVRPIEELRGFAPGVNLDDYRDEEE
jgi:bifunctional DNA-binding transcriptional regulator/antitoxin component of YhaV-PrlF toxin-antitoxin module